MIPPISFNIFFYKHLELIPMNFSDKISHFYGKMNTRFYVCGDEETFLNVTQLYLSYVYLNVTQMIFL